MKTVNDIMESHGLLRGGMHIDRTTAPALISALSDIPNFTKEEWTNSFCGGRYTSPSAIWTASDHTGSARITWSVNAATGSDNGYFLSTDSAWLTSSRRESKKLAQQAKERQITRDTRAQELEADITEYQNRANATIVAAYRNLFAARHEAGGEHALSLKSAARNRRVAANNLAKIRNCHKELKAIRRSQPAARQPNPGQLAEWELELI